MISLRNWSLQGKLAAGMFVLSFALIPVVIARLGPSSAPSTVLLNPERPTLTTVLPTAIPINSTGSISRRSVSR